MYKLSLNESLTINQPLADELGISTKSLGRYLEDIRQNFSDVITVEKRKDKMHSRKPNVYRMVDSQKDLSKILHKFFEKKADFNWVLQLLHESDPTFTTDVNVENEIKKLISKESDIFLFKSTPFEILDEKHKKIFNILKMAVNYNEYKTIQYKYLDTEEVLKNIKCLKLVFTQNNWYLAIEDQKDSFRLLRISFIQKVDPASSNKTTYQISRVKKYNQHFKNIQNAMTCYNKPIQKATFRASSKIAIYFQEGMKPFFESQKLIGVHSDGSLDFTLSYTQPIEILPFIKQWLPNITVLEPSSLQEELIQDLNKALSEYSS